MSETLMDAKLSPVYLLRSYAWAVIKKNTHLTEADYGGKSPVVPLGEEKDLSQYDKPHVVYGYALNSTGDLWARRSGSMSFAVYSTNFGEITTILNILTEAFERQDESAKDVNYYTSTIPQFIGMRFGTIELAFVEGGSPETTEGGRQSGIINIRFEYYVDYSINTRVP